LGLRCEEKEEVAVGNLLKRLPCWET